LSEIVLGDIVARLKVENAQFTQAMADAAQRLNALNQALTQTRTQSATTQQSTQQVAQAFQALNQSVQQQTQAYTQAQGATQQYRQAQLQLLDAIRQQRQEQQQATQATQAHGTALRTALSVAGGIGLATGLGAIVGQVKELGQAIITTGANLQQLRVSLNAVAGGQQQGAQAFQFLTDTANKFGFSLTALAANYRSLTAATRGTALEGVQTQRIFEAVTAASRTLGANSQQVERSLLALQQMVSKGTVSMEELRQQLGEGLPGAFQIAARAMGVTTERLTDMVSKGEVLATDFLPKFARQLQQELGQGAVKAADTAQAAFARLENEWIALKDRIARSGPLTLVVNLVRTFTEALSADRLEAEARQAAIERRAGQLQVTPGPGARPRPATLEGATETQQKALTDAQQRLDNIQASIKRLGDPQNVPNIVMGPLREALADAQQRLDKIIQTVNQQRVGQAGVAARTGVEEDTTGQETERLKALEAQRKKVTDVVTDQNKKITEQADLYKRVPELLGSTSNRAELEIAKLNAGLKTQRDALEEIDKQAKSLGTAITPQIQQEIATRRASIQADEAKIESIQKVEDARKKAEREAATAAQQAVRELQAQQERVPAQMSALQAFEERLGAFLRRPTENLAEEAASRVRVAGAAMQKELDTQIRAFETSRPLQAAEPGGLERLRAQREALQQTINVQAEEAYTAALTKQMSTLDELARKYGFVTQEANDLARAQDEVMKLLGTPLEEAAFDRLKTVQDVAAVEAQIVDLRRQAAATERTGMAAVRLATVTTPQFEQSVTDQLERLRLPREERLEDRLRD
jgi:tape measure domain-containing protein